MANKVVHIIGGGTVFHVRNHLALCAPAYGTTAKELAELCREKFHEMDVNLHLTKMACPDEIVPEFEPNEFFKEISTFYLGETNNDVRETILDLCSRPSTKVIFMNAAMCDFEADVLEHLSRGTYGLSSHAAGVNDKHSGRLSTSVDSYGQPLKEYGYALGLKPAEKVLKLIRKHRKDIFLVGFKTTCGASEDEQYIAGLNLLKSSSCNLVLANDTKTRRNMIITPEEARYHVTTDRDEALKQLVDMTWLRSHLTFTRSTVVDGKPISWYDERVPVTLVDIVNHCIRQGAYKPFRGATVGHFACKLDETTFLTSIRKSNFNDIDKNGLVLVKTDADDSVIAYGARPSVGGQSQRIVFTEHPEMDCIVHFHCPIRPDSKVPIRSQREYECGSHQCGQNTSSGLAQFGNLKAVYLDQHGPNIVFNRSIDPNEVIMFIEENFDLKAKTGGYVELGKIL